MNNSLSLLKTDIIGAETDVFWLNNTIDQRHCDVLVLCDSYVQGSAQQVQLTKIMDACKLSANNHSILQLTDKEHIAWHNINNIVKPSILILFGVHPQRLGVSALFSFNYPNNFDGCVWIPTLSLTELETNAQAKKDLWVNALKPLIADKQ